MDMQLLNFIIQPILGGAAGYITNEYAINMLFNTYTPFKLGGIIPKTREEFIENISRLVEEDIINKEKVTSILMNDDFIKNFDNLVEDFFVNSLYEASDNLKVNSIDCISNMLDEIHIFFNSQVELNLPEIIEILSKEVKLDHIVDNKQINHIISSLYDYSAKKIKSADIVSKLIDNLIENNKSLSFKEILGEDASQAIIKNISSLTFDIDSFKAKYDNDINILLNEILLRTNFYNSLCGFIKNILVENRNAVLKFIDSKINEFTKLEEFNNLVLDLSSSLIEYGKSIDIALLDLVNDSFIDKIKHIIITLAPDISKLIIEFAKENNTELKIIMTEALNETINEQDATKKALLGMAKGSIVNSIVNNDIADTLKNILDDVNNIENISTLLTVKIRHLLKNTTVADLVRILEKKNILTSNSLSNFILDFTRKNTYTLVEKLFDSLVPALKNKFIVTIVNNKIIEVLKDKVIFSNKLIGTAQLKLENYLVNALNTEICEITKSISLDKINLQDKLSTILAENKEKIVKNIAYDINSYIQNKTIYEAVQGISFDNINKEAVHFIDKKLTELKSNISDLEFYELINKLNDIDGVQKNSSEALRGLIINNLEDILQSFIKGVTVNNLNKLDDDKLCEMAKSFMGNNLRPIMLFGGMLGIIAGIILAILQPNSNVFAPFSLSSAVTYALVGYLTNAIAINMLFKPYKEIKLIRNIPFFRHFSLGYIAKNKTALAESMSYAISEYLLTKDSMNELIDVNNSKIRTNMIEGMTKNNYESAINILTNNKASILKKIDRCIVGLINSNLDNISNSCTNELNKLNLINILSNNKDKAAEYLKRSREKYDKLILVGLKKLSRSSYPIASLLPDSFIDNINKVANSKLNDNANLLINKLNYYDLKNMLADFDESYQKIIDTSISKLIPIDNLEKLNNLAIEKLKGIDIKNKLANGINSRLNSEIELWQILDGEVRKIANNALNNFFDNAKDNSQSILKLIKPSVSNAVQKKVTSNLSFLVRGAYNMIDGNKIVDTAVEKMLLNKLPKLIFEKKESLYNDALDLLNNKLLCLQLKDFDLSINQDFIKATMDSIAETKNTNKIKELSNCLVDVIKTHSSNLSLRDILKTLSLDSVDEAFVRYNEELTELLHEIHTMVESSKTDLIKMIQEILSRYLKDKAATTSISILFDSITDNELENISRNISNNVLDDSFINSSIDNIIANIDISNENISLFDFANEDDLNQAIKNTTRNLITNNKIREHLHNVSAYVFDDAVKNGFSFINNEAKNYFISIITEASIITLKNNLSDILKDIEFDEIAKEQINAMNPRKIHTMFNSFAGKYFGRLMMYGFGGAVFGINIIAGVALAAAYGIKNIIKKEP